MNLKKMALWRFGTLFFCLFVAGVGFILWTVSSANRELRANLLQQAHLVAQAVDIRRVQALTGTPMDLVTPDYRRLKEQFTAIRSANSQCRFIYLMGRKADGTVFIYVDSESICSKDYSPPGQVYMEASADYRRVFDTWQPVVVGPATDRWGTWVSALVPLTGVQTGAGAVVLGMDIDARVWKSTVAVKAVWPAGLILLLLIGMITVLFVSHSFFCDGTALRINRAPKPILRRLLPPLASILILLIVASGMLMRQQVKDRLTDDINADVSDLYGDLRVALNQQVAGFTVAAQFIAADPEVQTALRAGDADHLLATWQSLFATMRQDKNLTHVYFTDTNRVCLLRVHQPDKHGDIIKRYTALEAERTGKMAAGIELGPLGTFTMRVVQPVVADTKLLGYVELGQEIEGVLKTLQTRSGNQFAVVIRKEFLNRTAWEDGMRMLGRVADWDHLPSNVVTYASYGYLSDAFALLIEPMTRTSAHFDMDHEIAFDGKDWRIAAVPMLDAAGVNVGNLLVMRDITVSRTAFARLLILSGMAMLVLLALLLSFVYVLLHRTDAGIHAQQTELRDSKEKYRHLIENSHEIIYQLTAEGVFIFVSAAWTVLLGHPLAQVVGKNFQQFIHPDDLAGYLAFLKSVLETGQRQEDVEYRVRHANGSWRWHTTSAVPLRDATGVVYGFEGMARDITARKQAEEMQQQQTQELRARNDELSRFNRVAVGRELSMIKLKREVNELCQQLGAPHHFKIVTHTPDSTVIPKEHGQHSGAAGLELLNTTAKQTTLATLNLIEDAVVSRDQAEATNQRLLQEIAGHQRAEEALRKSEDGFRVLFVSAPIGIERYDRSGRLMSVNPAALKIFGLVSEEQVKNFDLFADPNISDARKAMLLRGETIEYTAEFDFEKVRALALYPTTRHGIIDLFVIIQPLAGNYGYQVLVMDITDRKQAETYREMGREVLQILNEPGKLPDSVRRVLTVLKTQTGVDAVGLRLKDGDDFPYFAQDGFSGDFLLTENTLLARSQNGDVCRDKDGRVCLECTCGLVLSGKTDPANPLFTPGGSYWTNDSFPLLELPPEKDPRYHPRNQCIHQGYASVALIPVFNKDRIVGLLQFNDRRKGRFSRMAIEQLESIAVHIGAAFMRKNMEAQVDALLTESNQARRVLLGIIEDASMASVDMKRLAIAIEHAADIVVVTDAQGVIQYVNPAFVTVTGYTSAEVVGQTPRLLKSGHQDAAFYRELWKTISSGEVWHGRFINRKQNGDVYTEEATLSPVCDATGKITNYVAVKRDISEHLALQSQLIQAQKMEAIGTLASGVAHEINNPIMGLMGYAQIICDRTDCCDEIKGYAVEIGTEAQRIAVIVKKLLQFARQEQATPYSQERLCDVVTGALSLIRTSVRHDHIILTVDVPENLPRIKCNSQQMQQVFMNLVFNARDTLNQKYPGHNEHKQIVISAHAHTDFVKSAAQGVVCSASGWLRLTVADYGMGIPKELFKSIFIPFFTTKPRDKGTGLGLFVSYGIIKEHGGDLSVESEIGQWTKFHVDLPVV